MEKADGRKEESFGFPHLIGTSLSSSSSSLHSAVSCKEGKNKPLNSLWMEEGSPFFIRPPAKDIFFPLRPTNHTPIIGCSNYMSSVFFVYSHLLSRKRGSVMSSEKEEVYKNVGLFLCFCVNHEKQREREREVECSLRKRRRDEWLINYARRLLWQVENALSLSRSILDHGEGKNVRRGCTFFAMALPIGEKKIRRRKK